MILNRKMVQILLLILMKIYSDDEIVVDAATISTMSTSNGSLLSSKGGVNMYMLIRVIIQMVMECCLKHPISVEKNEAWGISTAVCVDTDTNMSSEEVGSVEDNIWFRSIPHKGKIYNKHSTPSSVSAMISVNEVLTDVLIPVCLYNDIV